MQSASRRDSRLHVLFIKADKFSLTPIRCEKVKSLSLVILNLFFFIVSFLFLHSLPLLSPSSIVQYYLLLSIPPSSISSSSILPRVFLLYGRFHPLPQASCRNPPPNMGTLSSLPHLRGRPSFYPRRHQACLLARLANTTISETTRAHTHMIRIPIYRFGERPC